jgi:tRNA threonylcarbamoyl adenosine modification protein (Sua5/YciO/YrdC/YwlC family)
VIDVLAIDDRHAALERAIAVLRAGALVVAPTDTVYGVLADAFAPDATQRLLIARGAPRSAALPVLIRNPRQIIGLTDEGNESADRLMAAFWPGPLTLVFTAGEALGWDLGDTGGTVAIRMPADDLLHDLIAEIGPLACTGATIAGGAPSTTVAQAQAQLGGRVGLYLDGGVRDGRASTVVDVSRGGAEVRRVGAISAEGVVRVATGAVAWGAPTGERP